MGVGSRPTYSRAKSWKPNSRAPLHSHRNATSRSREYFSASARSSAAAGRSKESRTFAALILERRPCGLSTWNDAGERSSTAPAFSSPSSSYRRCTRELQYARQVLRKTLQAVIAALDHDLLGPRVAGHRLPVIEHLVARLDQQQITAWRDARHVELLPLREVGLGELVGLAGMKVLLRPEVGAQADMRVDGRIDQHGLQAVLLGEVRGVEAAQRGADQARRFFSRDHLLGNADGFVGERRQRRAGELHALLLRIALHHLGLVRLGRGVKAVEIDEQAIARGCRRSRRST